MGSSSPAELVFKYLWMIVIASIRLLHQNNKRLEGIGSPPQTPQLIVVPKLLESSLALKHCKEWTALEVKVAQQVRQRTDYTAEF